jgi:predicted membrane-bound spermidine synthase
MATATPGRFEIRDPALVSRYAIFVVSGFSGLIYESLWTHYLKLFLGHAAYAQTLVIAIFMGGLSVGALAAGRWAERSANPLAVYAAIEAAVGLLAFAFHPLYVAVVEGHLGRIAGNDGGLAGSVATRWALAAALIVPQATLLGATWPMMAASLVRRAPADAGRRLALLYFANSAGGALGVCASGFVLIRVLGLPGTLALSGTLNIALAIAAAYFAGTLGAWPMRRAIRRSVPPPAAASPWPPGSALLLAVAALTGLSSFGYEIGWIRMLSLVLGASTHAFELMLGSFILGLALGGWWIRRWIDTHRTPDRLLGIVQLAMGVAAVATLPLFAGSFDAMAWLMRELPRTDAGYAGFVASRALIAAAVILPAAVCAGMTLPLITASMLRAGAPERVLGTVYAVNTAGAIAGVVAAVHVGLPLLGLKGLIVASAAVDVVLGVVLVMRARTGRVPRLGIAAAGGLAFVLIAALARFDDGRLASGVFRDGRLLAPGDRVVAVEDGKTATVALVSHATGVLTLRSNGKPEGSVRAGGAGYAADEVTQTLLAAVPLMLHADPVSVALIGVGTGQTGHAILADARVRRLDTIEIEPAMTRTSRLIGEPVARLHGDPRSRIHVDDARAFLAGRRSEYDLVVSEPSNPWVSGVSALFSKEFYRRVRTSIAPGGYFVQWIQAYELDEARVESVLLALDGAFADYVIYALNHADLLVVASPEGRVPRSAAHPPSPALSLALRRIDVAGPGDIDARRIGDKALFAPVLARSLAHANSDYEPYLDQHAEQDRYLGRSASALIRLALEPLPVLELLRVRASWTESTPEIRHRHYGIAHPTAIATASLQRALGAPAEAISRGTALDPAALAQAVGFVDACAAPPGGDPVAAYFNAMLRAAHLAPGDAGRWLDAIDSLRCATELDGPATGWRALARGVARRDAVALRDSARTLLDAGEGRTPSRLLYLVAAGMAGALATGDPNAARAIWDRHRPSFGPDGSGPLFRVLTAHAGAGE